MFCSEDAAVAMLNLFQIELSVTVIKRVSETAFLVCSQNQHM